MNIEEIKTFKFEELAEQSQQIAIEQYRDIDHLDSKAETFGTEAFFNFEFYFKPVNGKFYTKLCPAPVTPKFLIKEVQRKKKQAKDLLYHKQTHSLLFGWIISQTLGFSSAFKLFLNKVLPLETISQIASERPIFGAISTEPLIT